MVNWVISISLVDIPPVDTISIPTVIVAVLNEGSPGVEAPSGSIGHVDEGWVGNQGTTAIKVGWGQSPYLLTNEIPSRVTHAGVKVPVERGMRRTGDAFALNPDIAVLTEAAAFIEVLVPSTGRNLDINAALVDGVVGLVARAYVTYSVDFIVSELTDASLGFLRVDFSDSTLDQDAGLVEQRVAGLAAACIVLREVGLVNGATLTHVLNNLQARLTLTHTIN